MKAVGCTMHGGGVCLVGAQRILRSSVTGSGTGRVSATKLFMFSNFARAGPRIARSTCLCSGGVLGSWFHGTLNLTTGGRSSLRK